MNDIINLIKEKNIGKIEENVSLKKYTTYCAGGKARAIVYPKNVNSLIRLLNILRSNNIKHKIYGNNIYRKRTYRRSS